MTGSIALFITTSYQYAEVKVNKSYNQTEVISTVVTSGSKPWIYINATSKELTTYDVTIKNMANNDATIRVMFELSDVLSYKRVYEGIIEYDAFTSRHEQNCYYFETPLVVGHKDIVLDFVMGKNDTEFIDYCTKQKEQCITLSYKITT